MFRVHNCIETVQIFLFGGKNIARKRLKGNFFTHYPCMGIILSPDESEATARVSLLVKTKVA